MSRLSLPGPALSRRQLIGTSLAGAGLLALGGGTARASVARSDLKFVFVRVFGGWDCTRVFATLLDNPHIDFEEGVEHGSIGDLRFVDHPGRPGVRAFFEAHGHQTLILNGLIVPSVDHRICERMAMTGSNRETSADWGTVIGHAQADRYSLPHVVAGGRSMPGRLGSSVVRIGDNGQVGQLLDGGILAESDIPASAPPADVAAILDRYTREGVARRVQQERDPARLAQATAYQHALKSAETMKGLVNDVLWETDGSFGSQVAAAIDLLSLGLSRCVTLSHERLTWDSHQDNDAKQHANFVELFDELHGLMDILATTRGPLGGMLSEETVVVVCSEMGRAPQTNNGKGKEHWAHTSALLVGPGITGGRVAGGFNELFYGEYLDPDSGEISASGRQLGPAVFGATLLELADVGPVESLDGYTPIRGVLA